MTVIEQIEAAHDYIRSPLATKAGIRKVREWLERTFYDWRTWARPEQIPPVGAWLVWLVLAGRGFGKTRTAAELVKDWGMETPNSRIALIGATLDDVRDTMVEGESGLLAVLPPSALRGGNRDDAWNRSMCELYLANGTKFKGFGSVRPDKLRGPQHHKLWGDEPMAWKDSDRGIEEEGTTWSNAMLGLRLGDNPQAVITGTPKRRRMLVGYGRKGDADYKPGLLDHPQTVITRGSTYDNLSNLAPTFKATVLEMYEGTRTGRQELLGEVLEDVEGALWSAELIDNHRDVFHSWQGLDLVRVVVGVDPAFSAGPNSDETGIIVAGLAASGDAYVLADRSCRVTPSEWAKRVSGAYWDYGANYVVVERSAGDLVRENLEAADLLLPIKEVTAREGKRLRAEPVVTRYEKGRVHHLSAKFIPELDHLTRLEDQLTTWVPNEGTESPDRLDALVYAIWDLTIKGGVGGGTTTITDNRLRGRR